MLQRRQMRYAHSSGHTDTCYSNDGKYIITCGSDGDVRIWLGLEDDDPSSLCAGEKAFSVRYFQKKKLQDAEESGSQIFVATDSFYVQALTFPDGDRNGIVARFTAPVTHLTIDKKEKILVAASQDMTIQVISLFDNTVITTLNGLEGPALSVAICPNRSYISVSAGDGILRIWTLESKTIVKEFKCVPKVNNFYDATILCRSCFEPTNGKFFVYPNESNVHVVDTVNWNNVMTLTDSSAEGHFSISEYSPCGQFIAASTTKGYISVWHVISMKTIGSFSHPNKYSICALIWNPKGNGEFAFSDTMGQLGIVEGCIKNSSTSNNTVTTENQSVFDEFTYENDDDDGENVISLEKIKNDVLGLDGEEIKDEELRSQSRNSLPVTGQIPAELQPPFQPGSSPSHLFERYMLWNNIGIIRAFENDSDKKTIDIEFHDTSVHHALHLTNYLNHTIAGLSKTVLVLACESPSKLVCIPLNIGGSREWQVELPEDEEALCITASDCFIALATDARYLRLFTAYGTQREVLCIPGPVVALASKQTSLLVAYHSGVGNGSDQIISLLIIHIRGQNLTSTQIHLPLSPGASLMWLGHTDTGSPATFDSVGILRVFTPRTSVWLPLYDHSKHQKNSSDGFFIVDVSESTQVVRGVLCKGSKYPPISPRPTLTEINLCLPICELNTEKNELEEKLTRWNHCQVIQSEKANKEVAIKLFALACRSDLEQRAIELVELLESPQILDLALKYASRLGKKHLTTKLMGLAELWHEDNNILMNNAEYNTVNEIIENRAVVFDASRRQYIKTNSNENTVATLKPLELKKNSQKRLILSETKSSSQNNSDVEVSDKIESQNEYSDDSLLTLTPIPIKNRNPFSKKIAPVENEHPFNFAESLKNDCKEKNKENTKSNQENSSLESKEKNTSIVGFKRKQHETGDSTNEKSSKQSKLSAFAFKKSTD